MIYKEIVKQILIEDCTQCPHHIRVKQMVDKEDICVYEKYTKHIANYYRFTDKHPVPIPKWCPLNDL